MTAILTGPGRKYSLISAAFCLSLVVFYSIYWTVGIPKFSSKNEYSLQISEAEDNVSFKSQTPESSAATAPTSIAAAPTSIAAAPTLPPEYSTVTVGQRQCNLFFTTSYLEYIATHQQPYCDAQSPSAFQCFTAPRLVIPATESWGQTDPLCIAQGVYFEPAQDSQAKEFKLKCKRRDIAGERASCAEAAKNLEGFRDNPTDWGWYWGDTGVGASLNTWQFSEDRDASGCTKENSSKQWIMLMRRDSTDTHNLWHKLMEILQARHSLDALRIAINPTTGGPWLSQEDAANVQLVFDDDREELLEPLWEIVTGKKPIRRSSLQATCFGNVILPLPGCGSPFWSNLLDTSYQESCRSQTLLTTFVDRVFEFYGIVPRAATEVPAYPAITIIQRKKNRKFMHLDRWVPILQERYPHSNI